MYTYPPPCRRHSCVYNVHAVLQSSSFPVLQFSSPPVYQFSRSSSSWSRSLEILSGDPFWRIHS